ncbi:MAG: SagB/ThcOx family dehydrogenase [Anaerolineae bacterium]|nr:SagB/ThcOx family dehydrogenase [Anaerolineae bacterium]
MTNTIGPEFMLKTRYAYLETSAQSHGLPAPDAELPADADALIDLPDPADVDLEPVNIRELIENRVSVRRYAAKSLTLAELSYLLWCTQGIKHSGKNVQMKRTVPSAGARHPFETVILANRVNSLEPGLYRYVASAHKLIALDTSAGISDRVTTACLDQPLIERSAVTLMWVAIPERMTWRYGQRGYRFLHLEAGHICQNFYLAAECIGCGVCAIAAYDDEQLNDLLGFDGENQFVIYLASLGKT